MSQYVAWPLTLLLMLPLSASPALGQADLENLDPIDDPSLQASATPPQDPSRQQYPVFTQAELDQMLAPIALYPDSLLSQILMASTYPLEVIEASRWSAKHPDMKGEQAVQTVSELSWDPSVKALVAFPQILAVMDEKLTWMEQLGDAFLSQREQVMETIQGLRQKAADAGNLESDDHQQVTYTESVIIITSVDPSLIYVPYYNPMVIYGTWWWPAYEPVYWAPWRGYYVDSGFYAGFSWGLATPIASRWFWGSFNWPSYQILMGDNHVWLHNSFHRRGIPYRDPSLHRQFERRSASSRAWEHFRKHDRPAFGEHSGFDHQPDLQFGAREQFHQPPSTRLHRSDAQHHSPMSREFSGRYSSPSPRHEGINPGAAPRTFKSPAPSQGRAFSPPSGFSGRGGFQAGSHVRGGSGMQGGGMQGGRGAHRGGSHSQGGGRGGHR